MAVESKWQGGETQTNRTARSSTIRGVANLRGEGQMKTRGKRSRFALLLCTTLTGGTLFGTCELRVRDAFVNGAQIFVSQALDPTNFLDLTSNGTQ